jgi:hypothetical protein
MQLSGSINLNGSLTGSILADNGLVSSSQQITNYYKFAETASANTTFYGNVISTADVQANKFVFTDGVINTNVGGQKVVATNSNILYLYTGTSGLYINNQANDTTVAQFTNAGQLTIGGPGNDQNLIFGGTNSSIYWGSGGPARMYYNNGDIRISSNGAADVLNVKNIGGISVNGGITGSIMATNGVVSGSQQIIDYNTFAITSSANTFYGIQTISGSLRVSSSLRTNIITGGLEVNGGITGSFKGNLDGVAGYASLLAVSSVGTTTDTTLYPAFTLSPVLGSYTALYSHLSGSFFLNGVTRRVHVEGLVVSGSNNIVEISGSLNVTGSTVQIGNNTLIGNTILSGSINVSGSTTFNGTHTLSGSNTIDGNTIMTGTNTIIGNTVMSGSIEVSGSSNFHNSIFIVTGSTYFTGSHDVKGNSTITGSLNVTGNLNVASGSSFYRAGNKLFNYGQWGSLESQSGSANVAKAMKLGTSFNGSEGITVANDGSGFPTRITAEHKGLYNIQFSAQLHTTANEACQFSVWFAMTGSNMVNSNTEYTIEKISGGGNSVAALNLLTSIEANDWVELYWSNTTGNGQLQYIGTQSTPTRPATPSIIVTVTQVA